MDGWIDGWMDRWMDRWMDGWMDGWMDEGVFFKDGIGIVRYSMDGHGKLHY